MSYLLEGPVNGGDIGGWFTHTDEPKGISERGAAELAEKINTAISVRDYAGQHAVWFSRYIDGGSQAFLNHEGLYIDDRPVKLSLPEGIEEAAIFPHRSIENVIY